MNGNVNRPDCVFVDSWLDDRLAGRLDADVARRFDEHVAHCERCRRLTAIVAAGEAGADETPEDDDLLPAVLSQTIGSPCARAETLLPALVDKHLDADGREVLEAHLAHCDSCSRLLAVMQEAEHVLPALAEIQPPPGFTQRVLSATTAGTPLAAGVGAAALEWPWWMRILARPRASLELGYVGAVLLVVLLGNPVAAFYNAEQHASQLAGAVPVARLSEQLGVTNAATGVIARLLAVATWTVNAIQTEVANRLNEARMLMQQIETAVANALAWIANIDVKQMLGRGQAPPPRGQPAGAATEPDTRR